VTSQGSVLRTHGEADLIAFRVPFPADPDLSLRYLRDGPFNAPDPRTFCAGEERDYVHHPALTAAVRMTRKRWDCSDLRSHRNTRSDMTKHNIAVGFALAAAVALAPLCSATDHKGYPSHGTEAFGAVPQISTSHSPDAVAWRIRRLTESLEQSRVAAQKNPLLLADVGYYQVELANARRAQAVAAQ
jgi:hypothetical protein